MSNIRLGRLMVVDDEVGLMGALREMLEEHGYETAGFSSPEKALEALKERAFDLLLTDLMMPKMDGIALLRASLEIDPNLVGIIMTGQGTVQTAVDAMKVGAFDYVLKPFRLNAILPVLSRALDVHRLKMENFQLRETVASYELSKAIAYTLDMNTILNKVADAAVQECEADEVSIMLPTKNGKELYVAIARGEGRDHMIGHRVPVGKSIAGWVSKHRKTLTLSGTVEDPRFLPLKPRPDIRYAISMPMLSGGDLVGILNINLIHRLRPFTLGQVKALSILASTAASAIENALLYDQTQVAEKEVKQSFKKLQKMMSETVHTVSLMVEMRDPYTAGHQRRVAKLASTIDKEMGGSEDETEGIRIAGLLHDIGKISIPTEILSKPGRLSEAEFRLIQLHTQVGYEILKGIEFPWPVAQVALEHHERLNGSGYPLGIKGQEMLPESKVMAVADVVEAMSSHRPYRPALGIDKALEEISKNSDVLYDPKVVEACLKAFENGFSFESL